MHIFAFVPTYVWLEETKHLRSLKSCKQRLSAHSACKWLGNIMHNLISSSSSTASRCSACLPSTSPTSSISVTSLWGRSTSSPSSSWAVWSYCGSSRRPRLPSSSPWWYMYNSHSTPKIFNNQELFLQQVTFSRTGAGFGVCQEADGLHLQQERAQLAGWPHAREQEEEAGGRWWGHWKLNGPTFHSLHLGVEVRYTDTGDLTLSPGRGRGGGAEYRGGGRSCASAIRRVQVSQKRRFHKNCSSEKVFIALNSCTTSLSAEGSLSSTSPMKCPRALLETRGTPAAKNPPDNLRPQEPLEHGTNWLHKLQTRTRHTYSQLLLMTGVSRWGCVGRFPFCTFAFKVYLI